MKLYIDFETRSELDVTEVGPYKYASHPSTEIILVSYQINDKPVKSWLPLFEPMPHDFNVSLSMSKHGRCAIIAHNAEFEEHLWNIAGFRQGITRNLELDRRMISCTAARAAAMGYPRKLERLAKALKLPIEKDMMGHRVMLRMSQPRLAWEKDPTQDKWHEGEVDFLILKEYGATDIAVEVMVDKIFPELTPFERQLWELTCKINERGIKTETKLISNVISMLDYFEKKYTEELIELTNGFVTSVGQTEKIAEWLWTKDCKIMNLQKQTVIDMLTTDIKSSAARRVLEIRQLLGKSSTKKFTSFQDRTDENGVVRDLLVYSAAVPTNRWAGSGIQPQNFPRGTVKDTSAGLELIEICDPQLIDFIYDSPLGMFSSCLRNMIIPHSGNGFICADWAQIETRFLFWLVGEKRGLQAFLNGDDLYKEMAAEIFNKLIELITADERFVGKESVLGCGFQMGAPKFVAQCAAKNVKIPKELGEKAVKAYRRKFPRVPKFWKAIENACIYAVKNNKTVKVGPLVVSKKAEDHFMTITLPSGRPMYYPEVQLSNKKMSWGDTKLCLSYMGVDAKTKQWRREFTYGGKLTENICQGGARDLMAYGMLEAEKAGYKVALTVHDEVLTNARLDNPNLTVENFVKVMTTLPPWAKGFPAKAEGWNGPRYKK